MKSHNQMLIDQRDGLLREAEYISKRLSQIHEKITDLNSRILSSIPKY